MKTINFKYDNGEWLTFTADGKTKLATAINVARMNMPADAKSFRMVFRNGVKTPWMS